MGFDGLSSALKTYDAMNGRKMEHCWGQYTSDDQYNKDSLTQPSQEFVDTMWIHWLIQEGRGSAELNRSMEHLKPEKARTNYAC